jgi:hypothetical protein
VCGGAALLSALYQGRLGVDEAGVSLSRIESELYIQVEAGVRRPSARRGLQAYGPDNTTTRRQPTPGPAPADLGLEGRASPNAAPAAANITPEGATGPAADAAAPSPPAPGPLAVLDDRDTADDSEGGVLLGRPDFGAIFRAVPPPAAAGAAGEALRPGDGTTVFACGPVGMIREVQVGL